MRKFEVVLMSVLACTWMLTAVPASATNVGLGANLAFEIAQPNVDGAENVSAFGWPIGGLRLGFAGEKRTHEVYLLSQLSFMSQAGESYSTYGLTANYQYNFASEGVRPFVTFGGGFQGINDTVGVGSVNPVAVLFGGGVGLSHKMGEQGRLRAEIRFEKNNEGKSKDVVQIVEATHFIFRVGFDLWAR